MKDLPLDEIKKFLPCYQPMDQAPPNLTLEDQKRIYRTMALIREFEFRVRDQWRANKIRGLAHAYYYEEAIATGACYALEKGDYITSTHRGHGHVLAMGASPRKMMAELFGKQEGYNHGKGGSMHIADVEAGILGATGIVASGIAPATGAALSAKLLKNNKVSLSFFGDGATNAGPFSESLNMAAAWKLPVIFLCENNGWAIGTDFCRVSTDAPIYKRAIALGLPGVQVDGFNVFEVYKAVKEAVDRARAGEGPTLVEAIATRILGHHVGDEQNYRDTTDVQVLYQIEPLLRMGNFLKTQGVTNDELDAIQAEVVEIVKDAIDYAENHCTEPGLETLYRDVYANNEIIL